MKRVRLLAGVLVGILAAAAMVWFLVMPQNQERTEALERTERQLATNETNERRVKELQGKVLLMGEQLNRLEELATQIPPTLDQPGLFNEVLAFVESSQSSIEINNLSVTTPRGGADGMATFELSLTAVTDDLGAIRLLRFFNNELSRVVKIENSNISIGVNRTTGEKTGDVRFSATLFLYPSDINLLRTQVQDILEGDVLSGSVPVSSLEINGVEGAVNEPDSTVTDATTNEVENTDEFNPPAINE